MFGVLLTIVLCAEPDAMSRIESGLRSLRAAERMAALHEFNQWEASTPLVNQPRRSIERRANLLRLVATMLSNEPTPSSVKKLGSEGVEAYEEVRRERIIELRRRARSLDSHARSVGR